jgi:DNA-binding IclR family transcriptional regulator
MTENERTRALTSPTRALTLLEAVADSRVPVRPPDLGRTLGWSRAAVHQHLVTLVSAGWLDQLQDGRYRLSLKAGRLGTAALEQAGLGDRILPLLEAATFRLREASFLAVLEGHNAHIIRRVQAPRRIQANVTASDFDLATSASGRVLTAYASEAELTQLANDGVTLAPSRVLAEVRRRGFAVTDVDDDPGDETTAIAVPLMDDRGRCLAAIGVLAPSDRLDVAHAGAVLIDAAHRFDQMWHSTPALGLDEDETEVAR